MGAPSTKPSEGWGRHPGYKFPPGPTGRAASRLLRRRYWWAITLAIAGPVAVAISISLMRPRPWMLVSCFLPCFAGLWVYFSRREAFASRLVKSEYRLCCSCGYSLAGLEDEGACPECGTVFSVPQTQRDWA